MAATWDESLHPRGPVGRFITTGGAGGPYLPRPYGKGLIGRPLRPRYPNGENEALQFYQADYGDAMNSKLRAGGGDLSPVHRDLISRIDSAINREQLSEDTKVYRGVAPGGVDWASLQPGDQIHDRGFLSTTTDEDQPFDFDASDGAYIEIELPKGTRVALPPDQAEMEVLVGRGSVLEIVEVLNEQADVHLRARLVGYLD